MTFSFQSIGGARTRLRRALNDSWRVAACSANRSIRRGYRGICRDDRGPEAAVQRGEPPRRTCGASRRSDSIAARDLDAGVDLQQRLERSDRLVAPVRGCEQRRQVAPGFDETRIAREGVAVGGFGRSPRRRARRGRPRGCERRRRTSGPGAPLLRRTQPRARGRPGSDTAARRRCALRRSRAPA